MKTLARLAVLILLAPALLLAQTSTGQATTGTQANTKPAYAQPDASGTQQSAPAATPSSTQAPAAAPATPKVPLAYPVMSDKAKQRARQLYDYFAHGQASLLYASFTPGMKKQSSEAKLSAISKQMVEKLGSPTQTLAENFVPGFGAPVTIYSHTSGYTKSKLPVVVVVAVTGDGDLGDLQISPVPVVPGDEYSDYQDTTKLRLPFNGSWMVLQGGRTAYDNAFAATDDNRYTTSFIALKDAVPYENTGRKNADYYCWGQPVLAPAAGVIIQSSGNYADHQPGRMPETQSRGNYVVIAHGNNEFSLIPYLKAGSLKVKNGQHVKQGEAVGECGDSGSSFAPHVEYSLQNTRGFPLPKTMPAQFVDYTADGKAVPIGEPLRGQMVENQPKSAPVETAVKPAEKPAEKQ
ncbi:MAG: M23 family metallopeptidase [Candidatus Korobacteraceae bacterium]